MSVAAFYICPGFGVCRPLFKHVGVWWCLEVIFLSMFGKEGNVEDVCQAPDLYEWTTYALRYFWATPGLARIREGFVWDAWKSEIGNTGLQLMLVYIKLWTPHVLAVFFKPHPVRKFAGQQHCKLIVLHVQKIRIRSLEKGCVMFSVPGLFASEQLPDSRMLEVWQRSETIPAQVPETQGMTLTADGADMLLPCFLQSITVPCSNACLTFHNAVINSHLNYLIDSFILYSLGQFFITTVITSWLDSKHVVFGRGRYNWAFCSSEINSKRNLSWGFPRHTISVDLIRLIFCPEGQVLKGQIFMRNQDYHGGFETLLFCIVISVCVLIT